MKKTLILLLFIMALLAVPFGIGFITQQRGEQLVEHYRLNPAIHAMENVFQRGWFHSDVLSKITVYLPEVNDKNFEVVVHQSVRQGPVLWGDDRPLVFGFADVKTDIELPVDMQNKLTQALGKNISLLTQLHYDGSQSSTLSMPEFTYLSKDNTHIIFHPLKLEGHSNLPVNQVQGTLNWQGIKLSKDDNQADIGQSLSHIDMQKVGVIWTGDMDWHSDEIKINQQAGSLQANNITIKAETLIDEQQRVSSTQSLHIEKINNQGIEYGPGKYTITLNHIPLSVFEKLDSIQQQIATLPPEQREKAMNNMGFSMFNLLPDILAAEPEIKLHDVLLVTPHGNIQGQFFFTLIGLSKQDMMNFTKIKQHIRADMQLQFPSALLSASGAAKIEPYMKKGWLTEKDGILHSKLHMADGILTINDQSIALPF